MPYQREAIADLTTQGVGDSFKVLIGGERVTVEWATKIGADGYGADAVQGCKLANARPGA